MNVSVIIPTYNRAHVLERALTSVFKQTKAAYEIIVIDDGSTDKTQALLGRFSGQIVVIYQENRGVSAARNRGIEKAMGDWIAFLDSDDAWLPNRLEVQCTAIKLFPQSHIIHSDEIWIRNGVRVNPCKHHQKRGGRIFKHCLPRCVVSPSAVLMDRQVFEDIGLFDEHLPACEDYDLWLRIALTYNFHYCDEALIIKYGGHDDQLSRRFWGMDRFRVHALEKILTLQNFMDDERQATLKILLKKLKVLMKGCVKHGRHRDAKIFEEKWHYYQSKHVGD